MTLADELAISPAVIQDAGELLTLQRAAYVTEGQLHNNAFLPPLVESLDELTVAIQSKPVFCARMGTRLVGAIRLTIKGSTGEIGRIAVAPDLQGRGIGTHLIAHLEAHAPPDVARFELYTGPNSVANIRLYERLGYTQFEPVGRAIDNDLVYLAKPRVSH